VLRAEARERDHRRRSGSARARRACGEEVQRGRRAGRRDLRDQDRGGVAQDFYWPTPTTDGQSLNVD
jgi:hypothetical protein